MSNMLTFMSRSLIVTLKHQEKKKLINKQDYIAKPASKRFKWGLIEHIPTKMKVLVIWVSTSQVASLHSLITIVVVES